MARLDPHSFTDSTQPVVRELDWKARVDFDRSILDCEVVLVLDSPGSGPLDLDTRGLRIESVVAGDGRSIPFVMGETDPVIGQRLSVTLPPGTDRIRIRYATSPGASALQWLTPAQTLGGRHPFLFSQCQSVHARSVMPLQDTPRHRVRYRAELTVPAALRGLMAARFVSREERGHVAVERYEMPQAVPPYLLAFAVGELASKDLGRRSRVWAEPAALEAAAFEFAEVDAMLAKAERLFGPYDWERFDILTMPPSFPFGGMENPRLTFLTPSLLAGDRSLVAVVAHELAHSWTGNLVTNANAEHFWLNEGFTVFAERRIVEALYGEEVRALHAALGRRHLDAAIEKFRDRPDLTKLRMNLAGIDADDAYSEVAYEKGYLFLRAIEERVGRERFDGFLRAYIETFRFRSLTTEEFIAFAERELPGVLEAVSGLTWLYEPGIPPNAPVSRSSRLEALEKLGASLPTPELARTWTPIEWSLYLERMARPAPRALCEGLEAAYGLSSSKNYEILVAWLDLALSSGFDSVLPKTEEVLGRIGRMKYLRPLYTALAKRDPVHARALFERLKPSYHPIAQQVIETLLVRQQA